MFSKHLLLLLTICGITLFFQTSVDAAKTKAPTLIYSLSTDQQAIGAIGAYGIPCYAVIAGQNCRGTYLSLVKTTGLGYLSGLVTGDVLLSLNDRVVDTPARCDQIAHDLSGLRVKVKYARKNGNALSVLTTSTVWTLSSESQMRHPADETMDAYGTGVKSKAKRYSVDELEALMLQVVNNDRAMNGNLKPMRASKMLGKMARAYADDMAKRSFFGHKDPDGRNTAERAVLSGIKGHCAENLAYVTGGADYREMVKRCEMNMMNEPKNDPTNHRANILDPDHTTGGIGVAYLTGGGVVTVQEFSHDDLP